MLSNSMYLKTVAVVLMLFTNISKADFATPFTGINNKVGDISEAHGYVVALDPNTENCTHFLVIVMDDCTRHIVINATAKKNVVTQSLLGRPVIIKAKVISRNENAQTKKMEIELEILSVRPLEEQKHHNKQPVSDPNSLPAGQKASQQRSFLSTETILKGWESSYLGIKSMQVSYTHQLLDFEPPPANKDSIRPIQYQHLERVEEGQRYHTRYSIAKDGFADPNNLMENTFDGKVTKEYRGVGKSGLICLGLINRDVETMNVLQQYLLLDIMLSKKYAERYPHGTPRFSEYLLNPNAQVLPYLESVANQLCHVIEIRGKSGKSVCRIWVAHDRGMLPLKYHFDNGDNVYTVDQEVEEIGETKTDSGVIWYPKKAYRTENGCYGKMKFQLTTHTFIPNVQVDANSFRFDFPNGTRVLDRISGRQYTVGVEPNKPDPNQQPVSAPNFTQSKIDAPNSLPAYSAPPREKLF